MYYSKYDKKTGCSHDEEFHLIVPNSNIKAGI